MTSTSRNAFARVLTPSALVRLALPWIAVVALPLFHGLLAPPAPPLSLITALVVTVGVIVIAAAGVVQQAEQLAHRMGDPYGSLILTLSIVIIEVVLIAAVMLGPGKHETIARDSVTAVAIIIMGLVIGLSLLAGARRKSLAHNRTGTSQYVAMIAVLATIAFVLPAAAGSDGSFTEQQAIPIAGLTIALYAFFLWRQLGTQAKDFREVTPVAPPSRRTSVTGVSPRTAIGADRGSDRSAAESAAERGSGTGGGDTDGSGCGSGSGSGSGSGAGAGSGPAISPPHTASVDIREVLRTHRSELLVRVGVLVATMVPIVLLSHDLASLLDDGITQLGAPPALSGALIACIVFTPEAITSVRAALTGEIQRVFNLCLGALVSTVGLTIPVVLLLGAATGSTVILAESPAMLAMLLVTIALTAITTAAPRVTATHGAAHLSLFALYGLLLFTA